MTQTIERMTGSKLKTGRNLRIDGALYVVVSSEKNYDGWINTLRSATDAEIRQSEMARIEREITAVRRNIAPYYVTERSSQDAELKAQLAGLMAQLETLKANA